MKFNKEKTKKFQKGGKSPKEIMEEARRNQLIERQAQARDAVKTSGIPTFQSQQVSINVPRPTVDLTLPELTQRSDLKSMFKTRGEAFNYARKKGWTDFNWGGGRFHTRTAEEEAKSNTTAANTTAVNNSTATATANAPLSEEQLRKNAIIRERGTEGLEISKNPYDEWTLPTLVLTGIASTSNKSGVPQSALRSTATQSRNPNFMERGLFGWISDNLKRVDQKNKAIQAENKRIWNEKYAKHQQGGQLPSYQQGNKLHLRNIWERIFGITPDYIPVNSQESITSYMDNTWRGPVEKRVIRKEVPYGTLDSSMSILNPGTHRSDTTVTTPEGITYNMDDVRSGKVPSGYGYKFFKKPTGYFQQGGTIDQEESGSTDQLYVDFAIRYLKAKGVSEDDMVDNEGGLKDEFLEEITTAINEVDSPDFWEQYQSNPDAVVQSYVESKMEPEQIEMARKGAKLKQLKSKQKRCKCGCSMEIHEEGGKITETCACCGNKITKHQSGGFFYSIYNPKENNPKNFKGTSVFSEVKGQKNPTYHNMNRDGKFIHPTPIISEIIQDGDTIYRTGTDWSRPSPRLGRANTTEGARSNSPYREDYERAKNYFYNLYNNSEPMDLIQEGYEVRRIRDSLRNKYNFKRIYGK